VIVKLSQRGEVGHATPAMDKARRSQNGKKKKVNQAAPISRQRNIGEKSRDQSERHEGQEPKNLATRIEFFQLGELENVTQTIRVQVEESHGEINRYEAETVDDKQRGKL
jgi:hypothetical protein